MLGRTDLELDEEGRAQAAALPARLGPVDAVWASPLARATGTAAALGLPVRTDPDLVEMDQGEMEGLTGPELAARFGELVARWRRDPAGIRLPGGESFEEVQARAYAALGRIAAAQHPGERVAVVTHQLVISFLCCGLAGAPASDWRRFGHLNCGWAEVDATPGLRLVATHQGGA